MKIFDLEYLFFRLIRRFKGRFKKAVIKKKLTASHLLRLASLALIAFNIFSLSPKGETKEVPVENEGLVLSQAVTAPKILLPQPISDQLEPLLVLAQSVLVVDATSSAVLLEKNSQQSRPFASLTKIMTALVTLESRALNEEIEVSRGCTQVAGLKVGFAVGEKFSVEDLLYALLLPSSSEAACLLGESLAESNSATASATFIAKMNAQSQSLGLKDTHFTNATGLETPDSDGDHYSNVWDLTVLTQAALKNGAFKKIVAQSRKTITSTDGQTSFELKSTNELLAVDPGFKGVKTGFTDKALGCLAFFYERDGRQVIGVILGSDDRFGDAQKLVDWVFRNYRWE